MDSMKKHHERKNSEVSVITDPADDLKPIDNGASAGILMTELRPRIYTDRHLKY